MGVLIVIPTVTGREEYFDRCFEAYYETCPNMQFVSFKDMDTCGAAWNAGAKEAALGGFTYVHMTADDLIPHAGWYECAVETIAAGYLPCARVLHADGSIQVNGTWNQEQPDWTEAVGASVPFCKTEDWIPIPNIHYWSDNAFDTAQKIINRYTFMARTNYAFTHFTSPTGRLWTHEEDKKVFEEWKDTLCASY